MTASTKNVKDTSALDALIGNKINQLRLASGMTRHLLAEKVGVTHQQLQKYESAANRVSCSRLYDLARVLGMPVQAFFAGTGSDEEKGPPSVQSHQSENLTLDLATEYSKLDPSLRNQLSKTAKALARSTGKPD